MAADRGERGERGPKGDTGTDVYPEGTPFWLKLVLFSLQKFGLATLIVLVGGWWVCTRVGEPIIASYTESIRLQTKVLAEATESIRAIKTFTDEHAAFSAKAREMMTQFVSDASRQNNAILRNQEQLLKDHQEFMAKVNRLQTPNPRTE